MRQRIFFVARSVLMLSILILIFHIAVVAFFENVLRHYSEWKLTEYVDDYLCYSKEFSKPLCRFRTSLNHIYTSITVLSIIIVLFLNTFFEVHLMSSDDEIVDRPFLHRLIQFYSQHKKHKGAGVQ